MEPIPGGRIEMTILNGQNISCDTLQLDSNLLLRAELIVKNQLANMCNAIVLEDRNRRGR